MRRSRADSFAAEPTERVVRLALLSTVFPYLPHGNVWPFRMALLLGTLLLILFGLLRTLAPGLMASALFLPIVYVLYVYEVGVYDRQPLRLILATYGIGAIMGFLWVVTVSPLAAQAEISLSSGTAIPAPLLLEAFVAPLIALGLMLVGPGVLYWLGRDRDGLEGVTFGVASALGFSLAITLAQLPLVIPAGTPSPDATWSVTQVLQRGVLEPLIYACLTGLVAGAFWLHRQPPGLRPRGWVTSRAATAAIAVVAAAAIGVLADLMNDPRWVAALSVVIAAAVLVALRLGLHQILMTEAHQVEPGPLQPCGSCARMVPKMPFCPNCGIARRATPRLSRVSN